MPPVTHSSFTMHAAATICHVLFYIYIYVYMYVYYVYIIQSTKQICNIFWTRCVCRASTWSHACADCVIRGWYSTQAIFSAGSLGRWSWREMEAGDCFAISRKVIAIGRCEWGGAEIQRTPGVTGMEFQPHIWKDNRLCALQKIPGNIFLWVNNK